MTKELTVQQQVIDLRDFLGKPKIKDTLASALPQWLSIDRMLRIVFSSAMRNPTLLKCTKESILQSVMQCAQLGLEPILGRAYLIPYQNNRLVNGSWKKVYECQMQPGYQGLVDLARRSNTIADVWAENVFANDTFDLTYGMNRDLVHVPYFMDPKKRSKGPGEFIGAYSVWLLKDGTKHPEFMPAVDIFKRRDRSQAYQYAVNNPNNKKAQECPWIQWPEEMQKKTVVKHSSKMVPASIEFMEAAHLDDQVELGQARQGLQLGYASAMEQLPTGEDPKVSDFDLAIIEIDKYHYSGKIDPDMETFLQVVADSEKITVDEVKIQIMAEEGLDEFLNAFDEYKASLEDGGAGEEKPNPLELLPTWDPEKEPYKSRYTGEQILKMKAILDAAGIDRSKAQKGRSLHELIKPPQEEKPDDAQGAGEDPEGPGPHHDKMIDLLGKYYPDVPIGPWCTFLEEKAAADDKSSLRDFERLFVEHGPSSQALAQEFATWHETINHDPSAEQLKTTERFNVVFTSQAGTPPWHYAQGEIMGDEKTGKRPPDDKLKLWLSIFDDYEKGTQE